MRERPPLELITEIETAEGDSFELDPNGPAAQRATAIGWGTQRGDGFADGSLVLPRDVRRAYPDLNLLDTVRHVGLDGDIGYEGYHLGNPRSVDTHHSIELDTVGWMTHAKMRPARFLGIDYDLGNWTAMSRERRAALVSGLYKTFDPSVEDDSTTGLPGLLLKIEDAWDGGFRPICEAWYDGGNGVRVALVDYDGVATNSSGGGFSARFISASDDLASEFEDGSDLGALTSFNGTFAPARPRQEALFQFAYAGTPAGIAGAQYLVQLRRLGAVGDHGIELIGEAPRGLPVSELLKAIAGRFCPRFGTEGVETTTYPCRDAAWLESTLPYDMFVKLNDLHLWELNCWEGPDLEFRPADLREADWEVRDGEDGCTVRYAGDTAAELRNGVVVEFTDFSGKKNTIYPTDFPDDLLDPSDTNPANRHDLQMWGDEPVSIPYPAEEADAVQIGRAVLAEKLLPKSQAEITIKGGYILDRYGDWQQAWKARNSQTLAIVNRPNDRPRLVSDTRWDNDSKSIVINVDRPSSRVEAFFNRIETARKAQNLTS